MIRRPPRSTQSRSSAASDVYKRQDRTTAKTTSHLTRLSDNDSQVAGYPASGRGERLLTQLFQPQLGHLARHHRQGFHLRNRRIDALLAGLMSEQDQVGLVFALAR